MFLQLFQLSSLWSHLPNALSLMRIPLGIAFYTLYPSFYGMLCMYLGIFSDVIDGMIARNFSLTSKSGEFIDPLADKFFWNMIALKLYTCNVIPAWFFLSILMRDFIFYLCIMYVFSMLQNKTIKFKAGLTGKMTAVVVGGSLVLSTYSLSESVMNKMYLFAILFMMLNIVDYSRRLQR